MLDAVEVGGVGAASVAVRATTGSPRSVSTGAGRWGSSGSPGGVRLELVHVASGSSDQAIGTAAGRLDGSVSSW